MTSAKRLLSTLISIISTRLELLANELQEERLRLMRMLFLGLFAFFSFVMAILLFTAFIVVLFWEDHRLTALSVLCALFLAAGMLATALLHSKANGKSRPFSASLAELARDRQQLEAGRE
ncbi:MAG: phage holin family protein [Gallionellaceae bacterium]|nr:phage holin family protein [Gallionellaceae bacterium]